MLYFYIQACFIFFVGSIKCHYLESITDNLCILGLQFTIKENKILKTWPKKLYFKRSKDNMNNINYKTM